MCVYVRVCECLYFRECVCVLMCICAFPYYFYSLLAGVKRGTMLII